MPKLTYIQTSLNKYTFKSAKIKQWVEKACNGYVLNLFAGQTRLNLREYRIDIDQTMVSDECCDAYNYIKQCSDKYDTILLDPPYSYRKSMEMYNGNYTSKFKLIADEILRLQIPRVISFGHHSTFMGKTRGYSLEELCVFGHSGAQHCTIAIVEKKLFTQPLDK